jgi:pyridoxine 5-phosphate synthase
MTQNHLPQLGVNIDHVATLRQLRKTPYPSLIEAAALCEQAGATQITVHLREDRRHIQPEDVIALKKSLKVALNLEMAVTPAMQRFALKIVPDWVCLVPEKRQEVTTEGGLDLKRGYKKIALLTRALQKKKIRVSLFVEPDLKTMKLAHELGADAVELHTGRYCILTQVARPSFTEIQSQVLRIQNAAKLARDLGMRVHAGHGLDFENVRPLAMLRDEQGMEWIQEYNIGHAIVCRAALVGMEQSVREMLSSIQAP